VSPGGQPVNACGSCEGGVVGAAQRDGHARAQLRPTRSHRPVRRAARRTASPSDSRTWAFCGRGDSEAVLPIQTSDRGLDAGGEWSNRFRRWAATRYRDDRPAAMTALGRSYRLQSTDTGHAGSIQLWPRPARKVVVRTSGL
jgi:hypothetical protein